MSIGYFATMISVQKMEDSSIIKLVTQFIVHTVDVAARIIPFAYFFKACTNIMIRSCVIALIVMVYTGISYLDLAFKSWERWLMFRMVSYTYIFFSDDFNDIEPLVRNVLSVTFLTYALCSTAIPLWNFVLGTVVCGFFIARSIWRLLGRKDVPSEVRIGTDL